MAQSPERLLAVFRRCGGYLARGVVTMIEFTNRVFDEFASLDCVHPAIIPETWEAVPTTFREEFVAQLRRAAAPAFRYHAFYIGGESPMSEEEVLWDADLRTARVRAWAEAFVIFLDRSPS